MIFSGQVSRKHNSSSSIDWSNEKANNGNGDCISDDVWHEPDNQFKDNSTYTHTTNKLLLQDLAAAYLSAFLEAYIECKLFDMGI